MKRTAESIESRGSVKVSADVPVAYVDALQTLAKKRGLTPDQVLVQGISTEVFIAQHEEQGSRVLISDRHGVVRTVDFERRSR